MDGSAMGGAISRGWPALVEMGYTGAREGGGVESTKSFFTVCGFFS